jgi:hypothetical protein
MKILNYLLGLSLILGLSQSVLANQFKIKNESSSGAPVFVIVKNNDTVMANKLITERQSRKGRWQSELEAFSVELIPSEPTTVEIYETHWKKNDLKTTLVYKGIFPAGKSINLIYDGLKIPKVTPGTSISTVGPSLLSVLFTDSKLKDRSTILSWVTAKDIADASERAKEADEEAASPSMPTSESELKKHRGYQHQLNVGFETEASQN